MIDECVFSYFASYGVYDDWPDNRGIFHNPEKTFLVWINEEDQLRIISMQPGGDVAAVFERLCRAVNILEEKLGFIFDDHLGFIAACPSNLGTGMRASVHIRVPRASKSEEFRQICDRHYLQIRSTHGEHGAMDDDNCTFDISPYRRLGLSEVQCAQSLYDGVVEILSLEKRLENEFPVYPAHVKSLAKQHLTRELFDQLKDLKTPNGFTLADVLRGGVGKSSLNEID